MRKFRTILYLFLAVTFSSFVVNANENSGASAPAERASEDNLTFSYATFRRKQVKEVRYEVLVKLEKGKPSFHVITTAHLNLTTTDHPLGFDLLTEQIDHVWVDNKEIKDFISRTGSLDIPAKYLGSNTVVQVETTGKFDTEGQGFQRSVDPIDKAEYVFTDFEPYYAHSVFPCFDQPDIKAKFTLTIDAPSDWKAIGNEILDRATTRSGRTVSIFRETRPISPYLFFVGAGAFTEWTDKFGNLPLKLYARKSLAKYVDAKMIFETSKKGLKFYEEYFGQKYPFSKFGQVFIPEFSWGGMENPGAIALSERGIHRGAITEADRSSTNSLILHEMAHMWFGDFVTMKWWNDLWLNESFATYSSSLAMDRAMNDPKTWLEFGKEKVWASHADQISTTHPIEGYIEDTRTIKGFFDGITYGKGAAALEQLHFFVGEEGFRNGVRNYFAKHGYGSTVREDLTNEIAQASKQDLSIWSKDWLQTSGVNRVDLKWSCANGRVNHFDLEQKASSSQTLSPHRTTIGLFKVDAKGKFDLLTSTDVSFSKESTPVASLIGAPCPDFVFGNLGDKDYALYSLDDHSLKYMKAGLIGGISDPLLRSLLVDSIGQMVWETKLSALEGLDFILATLEVEKNTAIISALIGRHSMLDTFYFGYLTPAQRKIRAPKVEKTLWHRATELEFFDAYIAIADTSEGMGRMKNFSDGELLPKGIQLDQDRRWKIIRTLAAHNYPGIVHIIRNEEKRDVTIEGQRKAYAVKVAIPVVENKRTLWNDIQNPGLLPFTTQHEGAQNFYAPDYPEIARKFTNEYFARITNMDWTANDSLVGLYLSDLFPESLCAEDILKQSEDHLKVASRLTPLAKRHWIEANEDLAKCIEIRKRSVSSSLVN